MKGGDDDRREATAPLSGADESRLFRIVDEYQRAVEAGQKPSRTLLLAQHPDLAAALGPCLDGLELVHGAAARPTPLPPVELTLPGAVPLGDFRIVREIGRGGMGVVYEAMQLSLGRRVALKVLPFAAALDERVLQRFKNEAQAAAQLHHSNIVPVHAVGSERGVHFYAMQLIDGQPLTALIRELRQRAGLSSDDRAATDSVARRPQTDIATASTFNDLAGTVSAPLTSVKGRDREFYRAVARLGMQAAEALEHAHQMGVVHRDIKPANLLLDGRGNLWVTDFGLALFRADAGLTGTGDILGTLRYMSPEQVAGDRVLLDHRTDVYSLGASLYELLTLRPACAGPDPGRLIESIRLDEPRPPRGLDRSIPVELETIVLKAMAKLPAERYPRARALADDLERFLKDRPIQARRPGLTDRLRKWARRHPSVVWSTMVLLVCAVLGLLLNNRLVHRERLQTELRARSAEERLQKARAAVDLLIRVAEEELADAPHTLTLHRRLLEAALDYYQEFIDENPDDPKAQQELKRDRARVQQLVADLTALQGGGPPDLIFLAPPVRKELGLTAEQEQEVMVLASRFGERRIDLVRSSRAQPSEQRRQQFAALAREQEKALAEVLSAQQRRRLRQIGVQLRGLHAFQDKDVIEALQLTPGQRQQIRNLEAEMLVFRWPGPPPERPFEPRPLHDKMRGAVQRAEELLTEDQRQRWREMTGAPVSGPLGPPPFGRPPG
jgi:serine/threonine protein kinase